MSRRSWSGAGSPPRAEPPGRCRAQRRRRSRPPGRRRACRRSPRPATADPRPRASCGRSACGRKPALRRARGPARPSPPPVRRPRNSLAVRRGEGVSPLRGHDSRGSLAPSESLHTTRSFLRTKMGRPAHCPPRKRALPSQALGDANRGVSGRLAGSNRESPPHRPPERRAFPRPAADSGPAGRGSVQSQPPVRTSDLLPTIRALGRAAAAVALLPAVLRRGAAGQGRKGGATREFESVSRVADELARTADVEGVARTLLDELAELFDLGFAALTFVSEDARTASGYLARSCGADLDWWQEMHLDLEREPSGIASAGFEATALPVYDPQSSGVVSRRLAEAVGAKSAAFVPLLVEERVTAVI